MHSSMKCVVQHPSTYIVTVKMEELTRVFLLILKPGRHVYNFMSFSAYVYVEVY